MTGSDLEAARGRTSQSREEFEIALDHLRESLGIVEGDAPDLKRIGSRAMGRLSKTTEDFFKEALQEGVSRMDQNALLSWFAVFLTGCAFGGLLVASSRQELATRIPETRSKAA